MINVVIVDDHSLFSDGLAVALGSVPDINVVATFRDGSGFLIEAADLEVDVVLLDLEMPGSSGIEVLERVGADYRFIVVSMHADAETGEQVNSLGAAGLLSKSAPLIDVAAAIRLVAGGQTIPPKTDPATLRGLLEQFSEPVLDPGAAALTKRERDVLRMMARGITATDELADVLYISQKTVKNHLASIYEKLAVSDRAQAAVEAIRLGLDQD